jgi:translation initiation factor IF-2
MAGLLEPTFQEVRAAAPRCATPSRSRRSARSPAATCRGRRSPQAGAPAARQRVVYEGKIGSLRRFKDDVSEVRTGFDCGIGLERFQDVKPGDVIEAFVKEEVAAVLS